MYIHWSLDTKSMILSMDALKLMLFSYNVLVAIDLSHQPVAIFCHPYSCRSVISTFPWVTVVSDLWLQKALLLSQSLPRSWLFLMNIVSPLNSWSHIPTLFSLSDLLLASFHWSFRFMSQPHFHILHDLLYIVYSLKSWDSMSWYYNHHLLLNFTSLACFYFQQKLKIYLLFLYLQSSHYMLLEKNHTTGLPSFTYVYV